MRFIFIWFSNKKTITLGVGWREEKPLPKPFKKSLEESSSLTQEQCLAGHSARPPLGRSLVLWNTHGSSMRPPPGPKWLTEEPLSPSLLPSTPAKSPGCDFSVGSGFQGLFDLEPGTKTLETLRPSLPVPHTPPTSHSSSASPKP